jgi:hypothetical protein
MTAKTSWRSNRIKLLRFCEIAVKPCEWNVNGDQRQRATVSANTLGLPAAAHSKTTFKTMMVIFRVRKRIVHVCVGCPAARLTCYQQSTRLPRSIKPTNLCGYIFSSHAHSLRVQQAYIQTMVRKISRGGKREGTSLPDLATSVSIKACDMFVSCSSRF